MNSSRRLICGIAALYAFANAANAQTTTGQLTGTVTSITGTAPSGVNLGDSVAGTFSYGVPSFSLGTTGKLYIFSNTPLSFETTIGGLTWSLTSTGGFVKVWNDDATLNDHYDVSTSFTTTEIATFPGGTEKSALGISISDTSAPYDLVDGLALPRTTSEVNLGAATDATGSILATDASFNPVWSISFSVNTLTLSTVPESSSVAATLGLGSLILASYLRCRRSDRRPKAGGPASQRSLGSGP